MAEQANQSLLSEDLRMQLLGADAIDMHSNKGADSKRSQLKRQAGDSEELVLSGRKKKKGERGKIDSTEVRNLAQQISKKEAKRIKQIKQRKEREARKADFLQVIDSHKLSSSQQQLLISTRDIGQSLTTKKLLASLLRKHRAGLELTASEQELLFQQRNTVPEPLDSDLGFMLTDRKCEIDFKLGSINSAPTGTNSDSDSRDSMKIDPAVGKKAEESSALLISFDDLYSEPTANPKCADGNTRNSERSKKRRKKRQEDVGETANAGGDDKHNETSKIGSQSSETTGGSSKTGVVTKSFDYLESAKQSSSGEQGIIVAGSKSQSMGKSLLAQFKNLKNFPKTDSTSSTVIETVSSSSASMCSDTKAQVEVEEGAAASQEGHVKPYKPQQIVVPEMKGSATRQTLEKTCDTITNRETAGQAKSKKPAADDVNQTRPIVFREAEVNAQRLQLPVCGMEQEIVEAVKDNDVTILSGETGSGKSTQIPQFLYEAGYGASGLIGITQPRRVAVTSTAARVAYEMGTKILNGESGVRKKSSSTNHTPALVGYQVRHDAALVEGETRIKFMTDGILLREIANDLLLRQYSVIILDEAHERNVNTDVLLGMLSRALPLRRSQAGKEAAEWEKLSSSQKNSYQIPIQPLKLIIMSATIRVEDFQNPRLFSSPPPVISVEARQYPVTTHFSRRTELDNYLGEAHKKVCQIHRRLPAGGILVFLTGKSEIHYMCNKLRKSLNKQPKELPPDKLPDRAEILTGRAIERDNADVALGGDINDIEIDDNLSLPSEHSSVSDADTDDDSLGAEEIFREDKENDMNRISSTTHQQFHDVSPSTDAKHDSFRDQMLLEVLGEGGLPNEKPLAVVSDTKSVVDQTGEDQVILEPLGAGEVEHAPPLLRAIILPLYAMLPPSELAKIFALVPPDHRLIVVATNVAETSITIPGIRYVVDTGRQKQRTYDAATGVAKFDVVWISKASADQRQGRAGRTGPGHCYRLYSSAFYDQHMHKFRPPEITTSPIEDLVLQMKAIGIDSIESFPFPTPPPVSAVRAAISLLVNLGALSFAGDPLNYHKGNADFSGKLTALGEAISEFPLNPRYSKMIILASRSPPQLRLLPYVLTMVSALAEGNMLFQDHRIVNQTTDLEENEDDDSQEEEDDDGKAGILRYHPQSDCLARLRAVGAFLYCQLNSLGNDPKTINGNTRMHIAPQSADLCQVQALSIPVLSKVLQLRHQLQQLSLSAQHGKVDFERVSTATIDAARIPPPSMEQETALRQIILSGYCDSIAKRVSITTFKGYFESIGIDMKTLSRRKRLTAYATCNPSIKEPIFIHPSSSLYRSDPTAALPEYICYNSLLRSHRGDTLYMSCCTVVSSNWLPELASDCPLLRWSAPLSSPLPEYDAHKDHVVCYAIPKYGAHSWELAPVKRIMLECYSSCETTIEETTALKHASTSLGQSKLTQEILALKKLSSAVQPLTTSPLGYRKVDEPYRWFARLLLEGSVPLSLTATGKAVTGAVISNASPSSMVLNKNTWKEPPASITQMKPSTKVAELLQTLIKSEVCSRPSLMRELKLNPNFLSTEIQNFLHANARIMFTKWWQQLAKSVQGNV